MPPLRPDIRLTSWPPILCGREMESARVTCKRYGLPYLGSDAFILSVEGITDILQLGSGASRRMYHLFQLLVEDACYHRARKTGFRPWYMVSANSGTVSGCALALCDWHGIDVKRAERLICDAEGVKHLIDIGKGASGGHLKRFIQLVWDAAEVAS